MRRRVVRYSEAFKQEIVRELEGGRFANPDQISRRYGIRGAGTVKRWAEQYGRPGLVKAVIRVQKKNEVDEVKRLRERIHQLESALADTQIKNLLNESYLELACERLDEPVEKFKKKHGTVGSTGARRKPRR
jgi:transposase-like protein